MIFYKIHIHLLPYLYQLLNIQNLIFLLHLKNDIDKKHPRLYNQSSFHRNSDPYLLISYYWVLPLPYLKQYGNRIILQSLTIEEGIQNKTSLGECLYGGHNSFL